MNLSTLSPSDLTYALASEVLEENFQMEMQRGEILAEAGMSAVAGGWSGYDGMAVEAARMAEYEAEHADEIGKWLALVAAAEEYCRTAPTIIYVDPAWTTGLPGNNDDIPF